MKDQLAELEHAERLLASVASVEDAIALRDFAEHARVHARQAKLGTASINHATVVKLRAERRIAAYVDAGQAAGEIATAAGSVGRNRSPESGGLSTYDDLGLTAQRVAEARTILARYTDQELANLADQATADDQLLSRDRIVRSAGWHERAQAQGRYADTSDLGHADVLLLDPPWRYDVQINLDNAIENHYPTMSFEELAELQIPAGDKAVMFCWVTNPQLDRAVELLGIWGFSYRTNLVWVKDRAGLGFYVHGQHELLFLATRGNPVLPAPADRPPSVVTAPRRGHSQKPDVVYELIERMYPHASKRELFARNRRDGWLEPWGLDAPT